MLCKAGEFKYSTENRVNRIDWGKEPNIGKWRDSYDLWRGYKMIVPHTGDEMLDIRVYGTRRGDTVRCALWLHAGSKWTRGVGLAGGCGYDKSSAAIGDAFDSAGICLEDSIYGHGDGAVRGAIEAVALKVLGRGRGYLIVESHS